MPTSLLPMASFAAQLLLQPRNIDNVPVLGKLGACDTPDVDRVDRDLLSRWLDTEERAAMSASPGVARDDLVTSEDAVFDRQMEVRKYGTKTLYATVLNVRLGKDLTQRGGIVAIHCCDVAFKHGGVCRRLIGRASASVCKSRAQQSEGGRRAALRGGQSGSTTAP